MSYAGSLALQGAVYSILTADAALGALVGTDIYEAPPAGPLPGLYVSLGMERVRGRSTSDGAGARFDLAVSVICEAGGFSRAKEAAGAVSAALDGARPALADGTVTALCFVRARAVRRGETRRIDLTFRTFWNEA